MGLNIAITSKYNPFTYEDYIKPLEGYWEDYDKAEQDIASAKSDLAKLTPYMEEVKSTDRDLYDKYDAYKKDLDNISSTLNSSGFTTNVQNRLRDLPTTYNNTILPIIEGLGKLNEYKKGVSDLRNKGVIVEEHEDNNKLSTHMGLNVPRQNKMITKDAVAKLAEEMTRNITANMDPSTIPLSSKAVLTTTGISPSDILNNSLTPEQQRTVKTIREKIKTSIANQLGVDSFEKLDHSVQKLLYTEIDNGIITGAKHTTSVTKVGRGGDSSGDSFSSNKKDTNTPLGFMPVGVPANLKLDPNDPNSTDPIDYQNARTNFNDVVRKAIEQHLPNDMDSAAKQKKIDELLQKYGSGTTQYVYGTSRGTFHYYIPIPKYRKVNGTYTEDTDQNGNTIYDLIPIVTYSNKDHYKDPSVVKEDPLDFLRGLDGSKATQGQNNP